MKKGWKIFKELYNKKIDGSGLAIFRIAFSIVLLCDILYIYYFKNLIFDRIPFLVPYEIEIWPVFLFWIPSVLMLILGLFTRTAAIINYMCTVITIGTITTFEYHMFYTYLIINFLLIFLPVSRNYSLDRFFLKLKTSEDTNIYEPSRKVSILAYYLPIFMGIGFVYFDSVLFKWTSPLWLNGLGVWLPASVPQVALFNLSPLLNLEYIVIGLGYITLIFETIFIFTFWSKKWRIPLLIIGLVLHLGILITFPIPFFALGFSAIYLLMVPVKFWHYISSILRNPKWLNSLYKNTSFYSKDDIQKYFPKEKSVNLSLEDLKQRAVFSGLGILILLQLIASFTSALPKMILDELGISDYKSIRTIESASKNISNKSKKLFGITRHAVFVDAHFEDYNHSIAVIYVAKNGDETWLPITNPSGSIGYYQIGPNWAKWGFRVDSPNINSLVLSTGVRNYTAFWAKKNNIDLKNAFFLIKVKKNASPDGWERDFLNNQLKNSWIEGGNVEWINEKFISNIKDIEKL